MSTTTVLLHEAVMRLVTDPDGFYVDGTFGRGGHTRRAAGRSVSQGSVLAIDKDPQAIARVRSDLLRMTRLAVVSWQLC